MKDLIKSEGEWISWVDIENAPMTHPAVYEAAVIAVLHAKWQERPLAAVVLKENGRATADELRAHLAVTFLRWQLPDAVVFLMKFRVRRSRNSRKLGYVKCSLAGVSVI